MYKKYVKKRGRLIGPYYYESLRENNKIKSVYLGKDPDSKKFKDKVALLKLGALTKGKTTIVPVEPDVKRPKRPGKLLARDFAALAEMFKEDLPEVPIPGEEDSSFEALVFLFISSFYVFGFFYLESAITTYSIVDSIALAGGYFPALIAIVNFVLIVLIYLDLRGVSA